MKDWIKDRIIIRNLQKKRIPISKEEIIKLTRKIFKDKRYPLNSGLSILFVDDKFIKRLNLKYLKRKTSTDILTFSLEENPENFLGDIIVSVDATIKNSLIFKTTRKREILLCLVHGILHLLGYNDKTKREREFMEKEQKRILDSIKV